MKKSILEIIQDIEQKRKEQNKVPSSALSIAVLNEALKLGYQVWQINSELRKLENENKITKCRTINNETYTSCQE